MRTLNYASVLAAALTLAATNRASAQAAEPAAPKKESQATLRKEAKITEADARKTALAAVPGGSVQSHELERENGKLIYSYDIKVAGKPGIEEINVDAMTGAIIAHQHEDPKAEAKERKAEAKPKKP